MPRRNAENMAKRMIRTDLGAWLIIRFSFRLPLPDYWTSGVLRSTVWPGSEPSAVYTVALIS